MSPQQPKRYRRRSNPPICRASGKERHRDRTTATDRKQAITTWIARTGAGRTCPTRVYQCPACHGWHLTSSPEPHHEEASTTHR